MNMLQIVLALGTFVMVDFGTVLQNCSDSFKLHFKKSSAIKTSKRGESEKGKL